MHVLHISSHVSLGVTKKEKAAGVKRQVDDVRKYTVRRVIDRTAKGKKNLSKARCAPSL